MKEKINKKQLLEDSKESVELILKEYDEPAIFERARLYIVDESIMDKLQAIEDKLSPHKKDTKRGSQFSIDKMIKILNPTNPLRTSYKYNLMKVEKYPYVSSQDKILKYLPNEKAVSANFHRDRVKQQIIDEKCSSERAKELLIKMENLIEKETDAIDEAEKNHEDLEILICGFTECKIYGQINLKYYIEDPKNPLERIRQSKDEHLSVTIPNVLIYKEDTEEEDRRIDMQANKLIESGYTKIARRVFIKPIKKVKDISGTETEI